MPSLSSRPGTRGGCQPLRGGGCGAGCCRGRARGGAAAPAATDDGPVPAHADPHPAHRRPPPTAAAAAHEAGFDPLSDAHSKYPNHPPFSLSPPPTQKQPDRFDDRASLSLHG
ncbi:hypothetical protein CEXT_318331 [Caerostris extrusa]|uniref:Uncharacterized protein n=1 Tax=Caerostris extrusa TaxID=172846 RepID=A0AAV4MX26_CAEEX|nr:hypothetical protein CEXT_318331 [Caerostris extrusa]